MSPELTFVSGLLLLVLFVWYVATEQSRRKRILGTVLCIVAVAMAVQSAYPPDQKINLGLDLKGGTSFLLKIEKLEGQTVDPKVLEQAVEVIRKRIDQFGVSEPIIAPEGNDRILVQIPGLDAGKIEEAREQLRKVAKLELRLVHPQSDQLIPQIEAGAIAVPPGFRVEVDKERARGKGGEQKLLIRIAPDIKGEDVERGYPFFDQQGWGVGLQFTSKGAQLFGKLSSQHLGERFAIMLDGEVQSAPVIRTAIYDGRASITGSFTEEEARNLASVLENPLAVPVQIAEERSASSTLGEEAIQSGILAGVGGLVIVLAFVIWYYRFCGLIAMICLIVNLILLIGMMAMFNFVLTLPGIAGIILSIGLAVDANVLIFERLREELATGKTLKPAVEGAFSKAFSVVFDANVTTLIMAAILFWMATGPVKGFAVVLSIGVVTSVFTAMVLSRNLLEWSMRWGLKSVSMKQIIPQGSNFDFLGRRRLFMGISVAVMVLGLVAFAIRGEKNFGIDFKGGDLLVLKANADVIEGDVRAVVNTIGLGDIPINKEREAGGGEYIFIRSPVGTSGEILTLLNKEMPDAGFVEHRRDVVGKLVGGELAKNSLLALGIGIVGILIYVSARFEVSFAVGAIVALLHDIIVTIGIFAITGRELSLVMIGAILTIAGYSINDTIVVFDRIREGLQSGRKGSIQSIMNASINETLSRTLLTAGISFFSVTALYFFGGAVLRDFAFVIMVGVVVGTYSSIVIASSTVLWWINRTGSNLFDEVNKKKGDTALEA